ncbi:hypothetical protein K9M79_06165 [Candidatus Woesearchaeota archaeon]|nr:hypothetical protein [Candidatus Woesearchaeota archaeon]
MELKYHYSRLANVLFLIFGIILFGFGSDILFFKTFISIGLSPPLFVTIIALFLGIMVSSGSLFNIFKGKYVLISANEKGVTICMENHIFIPWSDIFDIKNTKTLSIFSEPGHRTACLAFQVRPNSVQWPTVIISRHHVKYQRSSEGDIITVNAWLNKSKETIVNELKSLKGQSALITPQK